MSPLTSLIVPAYNEALQLPRTLAALFAAARALNRPFEIIVVNDDSSDATREIAAASGARVIDGHWRKISAVRNAGVRAARGDQLIFVDADTQVSVEALEAAVVAMEGGAVGGGAWVQFAEPIGLGIRFSLYVFSLFYSKVFNWAAGCFVFARREAFEAVGGFDERLYACEEVALSRALKR